MEFAFNFKESTIKNGTKSDIFLIIFLAHTFIKFYDFKNKDN